MKSIQLEQRFGMWSVVQQGPKKRTEIFWECVCDCGRKALISGAKLRNGKSRGCRSCRKRKRPFEWIYNYLCTLAEKRGIGFDLTYEEFVKFTKTTSCHYCEAPIEWREFGFNDGGLAPYNLDRKDDQVGYTVCNSVVCCKRCNYGKGRWFSYQEWVEIGKTIRFMRDQEKQ